MNSKIEEYEQGEGGFSFNNNLKMTIKTLDIMVYKLLDFVYHLNKIVIQNLL